MAKHLHRGTLRSIPELSGRLALRREMERNPSLRRALLNTIDVMWQVAKIPDPRTARHILDIYWAHARERFHRREERGLACDGQTMAVWLECFGALRNVHRNICEALGEDLKGTWSSKDVRRLEDEP